MIAPGRPHRLTGTSSCILLFTGPGTTTKVATTVTTHQQEKSGPEVHSQLRHLLRRMRTTRELFRAG